MKEALKRLEEIIQVQCSDGNWNYNSYMHGLANGLLVAKSVLTEDYELKTLDAPDKWLEENKLGRDE